MLKYGKPTYIDKTFAPNLESAKEIFSLAKEYGAPFFSTSALRYADELSELEGGDNFIITGGGSNFPEYSVHLIEIAVKLLSDKVKSTDVYCQGNQKICRLVTENGKKATLIYSPQLPYSVACDKADGSLANVSIASPFFSNLMKDMVRFFDLGNPSFDTNETLEVIRVRDELLKA